MFQNQAATMPTEDRTAQRVTDGSGHRAVATHQGQTAATQQDQTQVEAIPQLRAEPLSKTPASPLQEAVSSGQVSLDPATGEQLVKALIAQIDQADGWLERVAQLVTPPKLGTNTVATAMSEKFERLASSDGSSFQGVLTAYRDVLEQTHDAVRKSLRSTTNQDQTALQRFDRIPGIAVAPIPANPKPFVPDINKI